VHTGKVRGKKFCLSKEKESPLIFSVYCHLGKEAKPNILYFQIKGEVGKEKRKE